MDTYHVFWLLDELKVLVRNGVISEETARKMADYYASRPDSETLSGAASSEWDGAQPSHAAQPSHTAQPSHASPVPVSRENPGKIKVFRKHIPSFTVASIPVILSVIAAVLIAAGVISLSAYNWNAIPRTVKAFFAFVLLLAVQSCGVIVSLREKMFSKASWREGVAVLWSLMFGGVVAFISQICRLPGDTVSFLLVWSVSSVMLTYAMRSLGAFIISLILASAYAFFSCGAGRPAFLFWLLFASLCPFALRFKYGRQVMLAVAAAMLNVVMEHSLPGLWAVCSVSFAVLSLEYGISRGSRWIKRLSAVALCALLLVLSENHVWYNVGWNNIRESHSVQGILFDSLLAGGLTVLALAWQFVPRLRGKPFPRWQLVYPLCAFVVCGLFIVCGFVPESLGRKVFLAPTAMVLLFSVLFLAHTLWSVRKHSYFLLFCLLISACITQLNLPVLAIFSLLLLLVATGAYRGSVIRVVLFAAMLAVTASLSLDPSPSWHGASLYLCAMFRPLALPFQLVIYALYLFVSVLLLVRSRALGKYMDILVVCVAVMLLSLLGLAFPIGKEAVCMIYFFLMLFACSWHVAVSSEKSGSVGRADLGLSFYVLPFAALAVYFFWSAVLVMKLNCPVLSVSAFLLLFVATGHYWAGRCGKESHVACAVSRGLMAVWMPCVVLLLQEGSAFAVYEPGSMPFQMVSCACVALAALVLLFLSKRWKDSLDLLVILPLLVLAAALLWRYAGPDVDEESLYVFLYMFVLAGVYGYVRFRWQGRLDCIPYTAVFIFVTIAVLYHNTGTWFLCSPLMPLLAALYFRSKEQKGGFPWGLLCSLAVFASAFAGGSLYHARQIGRACLLPLCLALLAYVAMALSPAIRLLRKKRRFNYAFALYSLIVAAFLFAILVAGVSGSDPVARTLDKAMSFCSFVFVFLVAGYFIYEAYMETSLAKANIAACYAALAIVIKFFSDDYGFVAKGILFIVLGVAMLLLNLLLHRVEGRKQMSGEVADEIDG